MQYLQSAFHNYWQNCSSGKNINCERNHTAYLGKLLPNLIVFEIIDKKEIISLINNLNDKNSPDYTDVPIIVTKKCKIHCSKVLFKAFNHCIRSGEYPDIFKIAKVVPLHKKSNKLDPINYRPLLIISLFYKIFKIKN